MNKNIMCVCTKETEIKQIHDNVLLLKNDMKWIRKSIEGNGKKGIFEKISDNTKGRHIAYGGIVAIGLLSTVLGIIVIVF